MKLRLVSTLVLALTAAVFAGSALAGNGHGNGNANGEGNAKGNATDAPPAAAVAADASPGKSDSAPGQVKKDEADASTPAPAADAAAPAVTVGSGGNSDGVKPSNTTEHETHAAASSDKTKKYGNGKTAGQIAVANGAAPSAILHGPGNSQPHKVAPCGGGHEVDVHALKGKGHRKSCGGDPPVAPHPSPGPNDPPSSNTSHPADPSGTSTPGSTPGNTPAEPGTSSQPPAGGVASGSVDEGSHGVLAAAGAVAGGTLPFTGLQLWAVAAFALVLVALGLAMRRHADVPAEARDR
jgi:hypothetical protein